MIRSRFWVFYAVIMRELFGAPDFDFDVLVLRIAAVATAVEADVTRLGWLLEAEPLALEGVVELAVFASAKTGRVVLVVVEQGTHVGDEIGIIGDLNNDIAVNARFAVVVPQQRAIQGGDFLQVNLYPLGAGAKFDPRAFRALLVAIGNHGQCADDWRIVAGGYRFVQRDVDGAFGQQDGCAHFIVGRRSSGILDLARRASISAGRQFKFGSHHVALAGWLGLGFSGGLGSRFGLGFGWSGVRHVERGHGQRSDEGGPLQCLASH